MTNSAGNSKREVIPTEALLFGLLSVCSYIFTFSSQKAYLHSFGVDELFVSVEVNAVVRSGVWLIATVVVMVNFLHLPTALYSSLFRIFVIFRLCIILSIIGIPIYLAVGANWLSIILLLLAFITAGIELIFILLYLRKGKTMGEYFEDELSLQKRILKSTPDGKISDLLGSNNWTLLLLFLMVPYFVGSIVGAREGDRKRDFMQIDVGKSSYLIIHQVSDVFVAVGYQENSDTTKIIDSNVRLFDLDDITENTLKKQKFKSGELLRVKPLQRKSISEWYREDFLRLILRTKEEGDSEAPLPSSG